MKWYSVKEHEPVLSKCCVLLAVRGKQSGNISLWLAEWDNGWRDWDHKEFIEGNLFEVTHFCYPDPIPKVYDKLVEEAAEKVLSKYSAAIKELHDKDNKHACYGGVMELSKKGD